MTRDEAKAATLLFSEASDELIDALVAECSSGYVGGYDERVFVLSVELRCDAGGHYPAEVVTDLETGRKILSAAKRIIIDRRAELGMSDNLP